MDKSFKEILDIDISKLPETDSVNPGLWNTFTTTLNAILPIIKEGIFIYEDARLNIPAFINNNFYSFCVNFLNDFKKCTDPPADNANRVHYVTQREQAIKNFNNIIQVRTFKEYIEPITLLKTFQPQNTLDLETKISDLLDEKFPDTKKTIKEIKEAQKTVESITTSVQNKAKEHATHDYARIFETASNKYREFANKWLTTGIIFTIILIVILLSGLFELLPTENIAEDKSFINYNIGNIISRVLILAIMVFIISFSFKQYTINRHLQNINKHRANAFDSYELFDNLISEKDDVHRNELMLQLAKAIYEQTSTGYLSEKGSNFNLSLTEITKMLGKTQS